MTAVQVILELGHRAAVREQQTAEGYTHDWVVFVRGHNREPVDSFIDKIVFQLHESFPRPKRVKHSSPYEVRESGYAGFLLPITIYFKNRESLRFHHDLILKNSEPTQHVRQEKLTFPNPSDEFRRCLMRAGGTSVSSHELGCSSRDNIHRSSANQAGGKNNSPPTASSSSSSSHSRSSDKRSTFSGAAGGQKISGLSHSGETQHQNRPFKNHTEKKSGKINVSPSQKEFLNLFGTPIKKSSQNSSENAKSGSHGSGNSSVKSNPESSHKKKTSKESPPGVLKDKDKVKYSTSDGKESSKRVKHDDRSDKSSKRSSGERSSSSTKPADHGSGKKVSAHCLEPSDKHSSSKKADRGGSKNEKNSSKSSSKHSKSGVISSEKASRESVKPTKSIDGKSARKESKERPVVKEELTKTEPEHSSPHSLNAKLSSTKESKSKKSNQVSPTSDVKEKISKSSASVSIGSRDKDKIRPVKSQDKSRVKLELNGDGKSASLSQQSSRSSQPESYVQPQITEMKHTVSPDKAKDTKTTPSMLKSSTVPSLPKEVNRSGAQLDTDSFKSSSKKSKKRPHPYKSEPAANHERNKHAKRDSATSRKHATMDSGCSRDALPDKTDASKMSLKTEPASAKVPTVHRTHQSKQQAREKNRASAVPAVVETSRKNTSQRNDLQHSRKRRTTDENPVRLHSPGRSSSAVSAVPAIAVDHSPVVSMSSSSPSSASVSSDDDEGSQGGTTTTPNPLRRLMNEVFSGSDSEHSAVGSPPSPPLPPVTPTAAEGQSPARLDLSMFTTEYLAELQALQQRIMSSQDRNELMQVFELINSTGKLEDTPNYYDFDLCALDRSVVRKLQRCLLMI